MRMRRPDFDAAVATHGRRVFTLALYLLADQEEAEDVTQEVLIRLWQRGHEVAPERIGGWLARVTKNACFDEMRKSRRRSGNTESISDGVNLEPQDSAADPERLAGMSQLGGRIVGALGMLPEAQRCVVILREIQGLSYREISEALDISESNVRVTLHRGRRRLREELREVHDHVAAC